MTKLFFLAKVKETDFLDIHFQKAGSLTLHDEVIFVSTISGTFYAVSQKSGKILWTLNEGNVNLYYFSPTSIKFVKEFISLIILIIKCLDKAKPILYIHEYSQSD